MTTCAITILLLGDEGVGKSTFLSCVEQEKALVIVVFTADSVCRRISQGRENLSSRAAIRPLRDLDQPFLFELRSRKATYCLKFYDTSCPTSWQLLSPDVIVICYDISQRPSLINLQRVVGQPGYTSQLRWQGALKADSVHSGSKKSG